MKTSIKEIIIDSIAVATIVMPINWLLFYLIYDREPSASYIAEYVIFVITLAIIEYIAMIIKSRKKR